MLVMWVASSPASSSFADAIVADAQRNPEEYASHDAAEDTPVDLEPRQDGVLFKKLPVAILLRFSD